MMNAVMLNWVRVERAPSPASFDLVVELMKLLGLSPPQLPSLRTYFRKPS